jgi:hypothetical protein
MIIQFSGSSPTPRLIVNRIDVNTESDLDTAIKQAKHVATLLGPDYWWAGVWAAGGKTLLWEATFKRELVFA